MKHKFQTAKVDGADATLVRPANWNDLHIHAFSSISANTAGTPSDDVVHATGGGGGGIVYTLPNPALVTGLPIEVVKVDSGVGGVTVNPFGSEKIKTLNNLVGTSYVLLNPGQRAVFVSDGTDYWVKSAN